MSYLEWLKFRFSPRDLFDAWVMLISVAIFVLWCAYKFLGGFIFAWHADRKRRAYLQALERGILTVNEKRELEDQI